MSTHKKKVLKIALIAFAIIVLLCPIKVPFKDGGTVFYSAILYKIIVWNTHIYEISEDTGDLERTVKSGIELHVFPFNFNNYEYYRDHARQEIMNTEK